MDADIRFRIVFEKLEEARAGSLGPDGRPEQSCAFEPDEADEIEDLRRISLELSEPDPEPLLLTTAG